MNIESRQETLGTSVVKSFVEFKTPPEPLVANADEVFVELGGGDVIIDVLANDQGTGLFIKRAVGRGVTFSADKITFDPVSSSSTDRETFTYPVEDATGATATGTVTVYYLLPSRGTYYANGSEPDDARVFAGAN